MLRSWTWSQIHNLFKPILSSKYLLLCLTSNCLWQIFKKGKIGTSWKNWKFKTIWFCQIEQLQFGVGILGSVCSLLIIFNFALIKFSNLNGCHDAKLPRKSENLAHILGYQNWAVTGQETDLERRIFLLPLCMIRKNLVAVDQCSVKTGGRSKMSNRRGKRTVAWHTRGGRSCLPNEGNLCQEDARTVLSEPVFRADLCSNVC